MEERKDAKVDTPGKKWHVIICLDAVDDGRQVH